MATKIGRIDRGERPTVSRGHPDETRPYSGRIKQNLYNRDHLIPSEKYKKNYDRIKWNDDLEEDS